MGVARSQLQTAIRLWFADGDPASINGLASAAHEIIHALFRARGLKNLLFDLDVIPKDMRQKWGSGIRKSANFLKHARDDLNGTYDFTPTNNDMILLVCSIALQRMKEPQSVEESSIIMWHLAHFPELLGVTLEGLVAGGVTPRAVAGIRKMERKEFFDHCETLWAKGIRSRAVFREPGDPP